jgi:O-6-methylguanine DNA methyltransferase
MKYEVPTSEGVFMAEMHENRLLSLHFPSGKSDGPKSVGPAVRRLRHELEEYLRGERKKFTVPVEPSQGTEFQRKVWRAMRQIPFGKTKSYGELAREIGSPKASRAVGAACGQNPIPILVPCHRVLARNQKLGGFSGGLHWKKRLLALEGISIN